MEKNTLVMVLDPTDPEIFDRRMPAVKEPVFGVVVEQLEQSGRYQDFQCRVRLDGREAELQIGRLVPLIILPEEDLGLTPEEAFCKWAALIMKRHTLMHLPISQQDFLYHLAVKAG